MVSDSVIQLFFLYLKSCTAACNALPCHPIPAHIGVICLLWPTWAVMFAQLRKARHDLSLSVCYDRADNAPSLEAHVVHTRRHPVIPSIKPVSGESNFCEPGRIKPHSAPARARCMLTTGQVEI
ncbi:hypothetical protein RRG08_001070 [Elysia crispata]|uniref:Secreted protein n=1 Tax=Elysia crispata TaxID=231223 RepID=A0AAE1E6S2_9GAST|nr:hypothetical protein RRG08_001070 [Elysia crispata]